VQFLEVNGEQQKLHHSASVLKQSKPVQVLHASVRLWVTNVLAWLTA
jgi:hypothetical protein